MASLIRSLSAEEVSSMISENMWDIVGNGILTGKIIAYEGMEDITFRNVN